MPDPSKHTNDSSLSVNKGVDSNPSINPDSRGRARNRREELSVKDYVDGIKKGNRTVLSRAITLIESTRPEHRDLAQEIVEACLPQTGHSIRIGITGVPGVGKSTFIEALGNHIIQEGHRLAVLAIDPSSTRTRGSILGDKTRMETLSNHPDAFIRPSSTGGSLGGVARKTRETIFLCEAAGFDTIFIETVGVGQSETAVHSMVDFFLLLMLPGAGDELQGIKRGIMEMADLIAINKTDSSSKKQVQQAVREYKNALRLHPAPESGWKPRVTTCSALTREGIGDIWNLIQNYIQLTREHNFWETRRNRQAKYWMYETIDNQLREAFYNHPDIKTQLDAYERKVLSGEMSSFKAARQLLKLYMG